MKLVSACLAGVHCRYDCAAKPDPRVIALVERGEALPICPEQLGGLPTPREPATIVSEDPLRVETRSGRDVTAEFQRGAEEALRLARLVGAEEAVLKERSPSCGVRFVYRRTPDGREEVVPGAGMTTRLLRAAGLRVRSEEQE